MAKKLKALTPKQLALIKGILQDWIMNEGEGIVNLRYDLTPKRLRVAAKRVNDTAEVLQDVFGVKNAKKAYTLTKEDIQESILNLEDGADVWDDNDDD